MTQSPRYTLYDRVLDWFTDHRQSIAKAVVLLAVGGMVLGVVAGALAAFL